jgi:uncharacterized protein
MPNQLAIATPPRSSPFSAETTAELIRLAQQHHLTFLAVFGSVARGTATPHSDIDLAVQFAHPIDLLTFVGIQLEMGQLLGRPVDLIPLDNVYDFVRETILQDLIVLYEEEHALQK